MFAGIVNGIAEIVSIKKQKKFHSHTVKLSSILSERLKIGASVAHNGCCLTVKLIDESYYTFDLIQETLKNTNLGEIQVGEYINIERSVQYGDEIGGHLVSGHIMTMANITKIFASDNNYILWLEVYNQWFMKYIFYKGFICIDGISLTINEIDKNTFSVHLIPETLARTTIKYKKCGSLVNIEIDFYTYTIVNTTERVINYQKKY